MSDFAIRPLAKADAAALIWGGGCWTAIAHRAAALISGPGRYADEELRVLVL